MRIQLNYNDLHGGKRLFTYHLCQSRYTVCVCFLLVFIVCSCYHNGFIMCYHGLAWLVRTVGFTNLMTQEYTLLTAVPIEVMYLHRSR